MDGRGGPAGRVAFFDDSVQLLARPASRLIVRTLPTTHTVYDTCAHGLSPYCPPSAPPSSFAHRLATSSVRFPTHATHPVLSLTLLFRLASHHSAPPRISRVLLSSFLFILCIGFAVPSFPLFLHHLVVTPKAALVVAPPSFLSPFVVQLFSCLRS